MNKIFTKLTIVLLLVTGGMSIVSAQVYKKIGDKPFTLKPSAALEIESTTKGFLPPRVNNTSAVNSPATGLVVYSKADSGLMVNVGTPANTNWKSTQLPSEPVASIVATDTQIPKVTTTGLPDPTTVVLADATGTAGKVITITLPKPVLVDTPATSSGTPAVNSNKGQIYTIGKIDSSTNLVKIVVTDATSTTGRVILYKIPASGTGSSSVPESFVTISELSYPTSLRVQSDGKDWYVID